MSDEDANKQVTPNSSELSAKQFWDWCSSVKKTHGDTLWMLSIIGSIIVGTIAAHWFLLAPRIDDAAKKVVLSQEVLADISLRLRPYAVIDAKLNNSSATFEYDEGVGDIVESVDFREGEPKLSGILTFKMKKFVRLPLLRPLTAGVYVHSFWLTNKFDWAFEIRPSPITEKFQEMDTTSLEQGLSERKDYRFLVELLTK